MFDFITETLDRRNLLTPGRKDEDEVHDDEDEGEVEGVEEQKELVGSLIEVWWSDDEEFYKAKATIESYDLRKDLHKIVYVDGGVERLKLNQVRWRFVNASSQKDSPRGCQETEQMPLRKKIKRKFSTNNSDDSDGSGSSSESAGKSKDDSGEGEGEDADLYDQNEVRWRFVNGKDTGCQETEEMPLRKKIKRNFSTNNSDDSDGSGSSSKSAGKSKDDTDGGYSTDDSYKPTTDIETESSEGTQTPLEEVVRYVNVTKTLNLRVDSFENIDDVKDKYNEFEGIETKVFFTKGGFENDQELDFDRKDGSNVHLNLHLGVRLQINIKVSWSTTADKLISLDVHSWDTISDVKTKFQNKEGTPANQLTLFYNRNQLDDLQTLAGYDIRNHSTLDAFSLGEEKIVITVSPPDKDPIKVMVKLCSTVMTLKRMIHCMGLLAVDRQKLTFNGVLLENGQTLADYEFPKGPPTLMVPSEFKSKSKSKSKVRVTTNSDGSGSSSKSAGKSKDDTDGGYSTDDSYKPTTDIETESSEGTQTPLEEVVRYVNVTKTLNLGVDSFENIDDVKDKYNEFEGIETKVFFTKGGFENDQELDFDRKDGSNVHLILHLGVRLQINIKVSWSTTADKLISLDVHSWDTISDVKTKFQNKEGTPANQLTLFYNRKQLDDLQTLAGYDIRNHSTLDAFSLGEEKIVISVSPPDKDPIEVMVKLCSTVMTLKRMIHCMGLFAVDRQKLTFNGVLLESGQTLADYKIQKGSELGLDFIRPTNGLKIFVKTMTGKIHTIIMDSSDTVNTLKTKIKYLEGAPEDRQILMFAGKLLYDDGTLGGYDIRKECTVHVVFKRYDY